MDTNNFQKIKDSLFVSCRYLAERAFLVFLGLVLVSLILGGCLFYKCSFLIDKNEPEISGITVQFEEDVYQKVVVQLQDRQMRFEEAGQKEYVDIFK